ncbi:hypothetical protein GYMLUDRAFT_48809 [Collybiopsis luxurians FD-317 M1]|uniref:MARVEL domain-containing protein n=1 Tax=Collybiopsis luxurians FD-317 M1 TaxID=944289 RepID=A0A0D0BI47_9AGAR|nr:hypothetical protein GYMLUDRAFT_48809 [Collybiopsis luxurians FD-317 M1]
MFVINALPKGLSVLTWLSLCLSIITLAFSLVTLGLSSLLIAPCISFVTLLYLLIVLILEHNRLNNPHPTHGSFPLPAYSTLPSIIFAYFFGLCWLVASVACMIILAAASFEWEQNEIAYAAVSIITCYAATAETVVWFGFAGSAHAERNALLKRGAPVPNAIS